MVQVPERYFQMLLALHQLQNETFRNGWLTWVDWSKRSRSGAHPQDVQANSITEDLLFTMRTSSMGSKQSRCTLAWDSAPLQSAQHMLQSYIHEGDDRASSNMLGIYPEGFKGLSSFSEGFKALQHECLLFGRKFKAHTINAVLDVFDHPEYTTWNYTAYT